MNEEIVSPKQSLHSATWHDTVPVQHLSFLCSYIYLRLQIEKKNASFQAWVNFRMATPRTKQGLNPARLGHRKTKWAAVSCVHAWVERRCPLRFFHTYFEGLIIVYYTSLSSLVLSSSIILRASWIMLLSMVRDFADWIKVCWNSKNKW